MPTECPSSADEIALFRTEASEALPKLEAAIDARAAR